MAKSPAFQFYPNDWLSSRRVRLMTSEQRGWYIQLICEAWESEVQGTLPYDKEVLWVLAGASSQQAFNDRSTPVIAMFELKDNVLIHHRLISELVKQAEFKEHCSQAGKRSAELRRQALKEKHLNGCSTTVQPPFNAGLLSVPTESQPTPQPKVNSSSSSSSSTPYKARLGVLFKRRETTTWDQKEEATLKKIMNRPDFENELLEIEKYYSGGSKYLRKDIQTLLNNWNGELDRSKNYSVNKVRRDIY